jgi:hypothetical protein
MALGTATIVNRQNWVDGFIVTMTFAGDGTYPAGGTADFTAYVRDAIAAHNAAKADASVRGYETLTVVGLIANVSGVYIPRYNHAADKLVMLTEALADATPGDLSGTTVSVTVLCK